MHPPPLPPRSHSRLAALRLPDLPPRDLERLAAAPTGSSPHPHSAPALCGPPSSAAAPDAPHTAGSTNAAPLTAGYLPPPPPPPSQQQPSFAPSAAASGPGAPPHPHALLPKFGSGDGSPADVRAYAVSVASPPPVAPLLMRGGVVSPGVGGGSGLVLPNLALPLSGSPSAMPPFAHSHHQHPQHQHHQPTPPPNAPSSAASTMTTATTSVAPPHQHPHPPPGTARGHASPLHVPITSPMDVVSPTVPPSAALPAAIPATVGGSPSGGSPPPGNTTSSQRLHSHSRTPSTSAVTATAAMSQSEIKKAQNRKSAKRFREAQKQRWKNMADDLMVQKRTIDELRAQLAAQTAVAEQSKRSPMSINDLVDGGKSCACGAAGGRQAVSAPVSPVSAAHPYAEAEAALYAQILSNTSTTSASGGTCSTASTCGVTNDQANGHMAGEGLRRRDGALEAKHYMSSSDKHCGTENGGEGKLAHGASGGGGIMMRGGESRQVMGEHDGSAAAAAASIGNTNGLKGVSRENGMHGSGGGGHGRKAVKREPYVKDLGLLTICYVVVVGSARIVSIKRGNPAGVVGTYATDGLAAGECSEFRNALMCGKPVAISFCRAGARVNAVMNPVESTDRVLVAEFSPF